MSGASRECRSDRGRHAFPSSPIATNERDSRNFMTAERGARPDSSVIARCSCGGVRRSRSSGGWCDAQRIGGRYARRTGATAVRRSSEVRAMLQSLGYQHRRRGRLPRARPTRQRRPPTARRASTAYDADQLAAAPARARRLGLAADLGAEGWRALPLLDGVRILRELQRGRARAATAAAESMQNYLLAAATQPVGRRQHHRADRHRRDRRAARDSICEDAQEGDLLLRQASVRRQPRRTRRCENLSASLTGVAGPGARDRHALRLPPRLRQPIGSPSSALFAARGEKSRTARCR